MPFAGQAVKDLEIILIFIDAYNNNMNGVNIGDQIRANLYTGRRIRRGGWQVLCHLFLLEVAITNSFLLSRYSS